MADYKNTVFLPETGFPLRAGLAAKEPEILAHWQAIGLQEKLNNQNEGKEKFVLHDGPPYANGNMHLGHALNRTLKDVVNRTKRMQGHHVHFVPGWDCHGLPIEWRIEQEYRAKGKNKDEVPVVDMLRECRAYAQEWVGVQMGEIKRLGAEADYDHPYRTMDRSSEAVIVGEIHKFLMQGSLYQADRPVMWSVVEKTALAEAEIEYHDHKSISLWVRFPVVSSPVKELAGASIVIWTTTPWTLPANQAIAAGEKFSYSLMEVMSVGEGSLVKVGEKLVVATALLKATAEKAKIVDWQEVGQLSGASLVGTLCAHPLRGQGYDEPRPVLLGDFVTTEAGTGFVHIAPSHGEDDFRLGQKNSLPMKHFVADDGSYYPHVPLFAGKRVLTSEGKEGDANGAVIKALNEASGLLAKASLTHSYPHSWRSKAPIIFRCTPQWFVSLEKHDLRKKALQAIDDTKWLPAAGRNRIHSMVENRADWCLSRQRVWGVPIALFVNKATGQPLMDEAVNARIQAAFREEGLEAWHTRNPQEFLGNSHKAEDYTQVKDIADVWFDSASTHAFVLKERPYLKWPADLYLEGSDQHRGWFHSSLLESVGTTGRAPYDAVLTHGFVLDEKGYKMSKSVGNVVAPENVIKEHGADVLRLALINADYSEDIRMGPNILKQQSDFYRRLRNTLRYLLGALAGFTEGERVEAKDMPELEQWVLHRLKEVEAEVNAGIANYSFNRVFRTVHDFAATDLSAFYFDIRKDALYCDATTSLRRRAARTVMEQLFVALVTWLAPVLVFTTEEAWLEWKKQGHEGPESVHLARLPEFPVTWANPVLIKKWETVRAVRAAITTSLERAREKGEIRAALEAEVSLAVTPEQAAALAGVDMAEIAITSGLTLVSEAEPTEPQIIIGKAPGSKCERCWKVLEEVGGDSQHATLCLRCIEVISGTCAP